jgi:hypothetical protein
LTAEGLLLLSAGHRKGEKLNPLNCKGAVIVIAAICVAGIARHDLRGKHGLRRNIVFVVKMVFDSRYFFEPAVLNEERLHLGLLFTFRAYLQYRKLPCLIHFANVVPEMSVTFLSSRKYEGMNGHRIQRKYFCVAAYF